MEGSLKTLLGFLVIAVLTATYPAIVRAQARVFVTVGIGHPWGYGWNAARWHPARGCGSYSHYACYPDRVVIVRRPVYYAPLVIARRDYWRAYRHYHR